MNLTVFAAASLSSAFPAVAAGLGKAHPEIVIRFNFAGTQTLVTQIESGAPADVFASADQAHMNILKTESKVNTPVVFAQNKLAIIVPSRNPAGLTRAFDLSRSGVKLDIASPAVPAGASARLMLGKLAAQPGAPSGFITAALKNVVSQEDNVEAVVTRVALGEADAGIVYLSDLSTPNGKKVRNISIPDLANVINIYPVAVVRASTHSSQAKQFVDYLTGAEGQAILRQHGFLTSQ
ncbi:MAG TPA: molybdate ABC transporter substrate-binding protein [Candidatus Dormibacteraeota bacterium]